MGLQNIRVRADAGEAALGLVAIVVAGLLGAGVAVSASVALVSSQQSAAENAPPVSEPLVQYGN